MLAAADDRPLSAMVRKIVLDWLRGRGGLTEKPPPLPLPGRPRRFLEWFRYEPARHGSPAGLYSLSWRSQPQSDGMVPIYVGTTETGFANRFDRHSADFARGNNTKRPME
jgi:hypothetical protein